MGSSMYNTLWMAISVLESQEHISDIRSGDYSFMDSKNRREAESRLYDIAYPRDIYKRDSITLEQAIKMGLNIGK